MSGPLGGGGVFLNHTVDKPIKTNMGGLFHGLIR